MTREYWGLVAFWLGVIAAVVGGLYALTTGPSANYYDVDGTVVNGCVSVRHHVRDNWEWGGHTRHIVFCRQESAK